MSRMSDLATETEEARQAAAVARAETIEECARIAEAIDSGRGNEKDISKAIRRLT